ncbi:MAG: low molecular weight protein arginine phosphatase [Candidatus Thorarchaeota archaeon]
MSKIKGILFICLGNTARSPVAEYLARYYAKNHDLDLKVESAGFINAFSHMQPESKSYLDSKGIDSSDFTPQLITRSLLERYDLILTMESSHKWDILNNFTTIEGLETKLYTLKEFNEEPNNLDIIDPYYTTYSNYLKVLQIIDQEVDKAIKKIAKVNDALLS